MHTPKETWILYLKILLGSLVTVVGVNGFIVPAGLYNGGTIGAAQIIRTVLADFFNISPSFDIAGIINLLLNLPLLVVAYCWISRRFFLRTVFSVGTQTLLFSILSFPTPILTDRLSACVVGGILAGYGVGITLRASASGGGIDILGVYFTQKNSRASVGRLSLWINGCIYLVCAVLFELPTAIYSILYCIIYSVMVDKTHIQNITVLAVIFTKNPQAKEVVIGSLRRGLTCWEGKGGYTDETAYILMTVLSKYEIPELKKRIQKTDPSAFIVVQENADITGNYQKRL